jgi:hypothetical protein
MRRGALHHTRAYRRRLALPEWIAAGDIYQVNLARLSARSTETRALYPPPRGEPRPSPLHRRRPRDFSRPWNASKIEEEAIGRLIKGTRPRSDLPRTGGWRRASGEPEDRARGPDDVDLPQRPGARLSLAGPPESIASPGSYETVSPAQASRAPVRPGWICEAVSLFPVADHRRQRSGDEIIEEMESVRRGLIARDRPSRLHGRADLNIAIRPLSQGGRVH